MSCRACGKADFDDGDWNALAKHIVKSKDNAHKPSRKWANKFLSKAKLLDQKKDRPQRTKLTEQQKENKKEMVREISGETELAITQCPDCKRVGRMQLPVEYTRSGDAWMVGNKVVRYCTLHSREKNTYKIGIHDEPERYKIVHEVS